MYFVVAALVQRLTIQFSRQQLPQQNFQFTLETDTRIQKSNAFCRQKNARQPRQRAVSHKKGGCRVRMCCTVLSQYYRCLNEH